MLIKLARRVSPKNKEHYTYIANFLFVFSVGHIAVLFVHVFVDRIFPVFVDRISEYLALIAGVILVFCYMIIYDWNDKWVNIEKRVDKKFSKVKRDKL